MATFSSLWLPDARITPRIPPPGVYALHGTSYIVLELVSTTKGKGQQQWLVISWLRSQGTVVSFRAPSASCLPSFLSILPPHLLSFLSPPPLSHSLGSLLLEESFVVNRPREVPAWGGAEAFSSPIVSWKMGPLTLEKSQRTAHIKGQKSQLSQSQILSLRNFICLFAFSVLFFKLLVYLHLNVHTYNVMIFPCINTRHISLV